MAPQAMASGSLSDLVFRHLASGILNGAYQAGQTLPPERKLVETFGVNRHVVREALKRLSQAGLLRISQGGARVLDFREDAGLDMLVLIAEHVSLTDANPLWLSVGQLRCAVATDSARLCAQKGDAKVKAEIVAVAEQMGKADDDEGLFDLELKFWKLVMSGADNLTYRLAYNTVVRGVRTGDAYPQTKMLIAHELKMSGHRRAIADAIAAGDGELAARCTREGMRWANDELVKRMQQAAREKAAQAERAAEAAKAAENERPKPEAEARSPRKGTPPPLPRTR
jgi:DNA-binding FadR family transcriptional regulator